MTERTSPSTNVGTKLLFENDRVRVWDFRLAPGENIGMHQHQSDYLYVVIGDGALQPIDAAGNAEPPREMKDGEVHFRAIDGMNVHDAKNVGVQDWRNIVVELKEPN